MADNRSIPVMGDVTPATALLVQMALGRRRTTKKRRTVRKKTARRRPAKRRASSRRRTSSRKGRLKKGSPAAKRHMAKLRRMQRRNR